MVDIYLCARKHRLPGYHIDYNDIENYPGINLCCDMRKFTLDFLKRYDFIIATPPCNYYSRANWRREKSKVALETKDLLPRCIDLCIRSGKPFIVENVCNDKLLPHYPGIIEFDFGQHHFYTNVFFLIPHKSIAIRQNKQYLTRSKRDDNFNVHFIINIFLNSIYI